MAWLLPALRAVLPHVGTILSAASPVFTKKRTDAAAEQNALLQQQIGELQAAVSQNTDYIRDLQANLKRATLLCIAALALSTIALCAALFIALR